MKVTKQELLDTIAHISEKLDGVLEKVSDQERQIRDLKSHNSDLVQNNRKTLDQIKEYIKELEEIRNHYVNSSNQSSGQEV